MDVFSRVAVVRNGGLVETLHWDGAEGFMLEANFAAMGQRVETEKTDLEARRDLRTWAELAQTEDDFEVEFADADALAAIMEGQEWHGLDAKQKSRTR
jgi:hypothetical protein